MLVLSRKLHESIDIGDDISVMIVSIEGHRVGLGITAPRHIEINRSEIVERVELPPAPRTLDGRREELLIESFYDDGILGGSN